MNNRVSRNPKWYTRLIPALVIALLAGCASSKPTQPQTPATPFAPNTPSAPSNTPKAPPVTVRFGSVGGLTDAGVYLADDLGYFAEAGIHVERVRMASAPNLTTALATGQLDVAGISVSPGLYNSIKAGIKLRIVGDKQSIRPSMSATQLIAKSDLVVKGDTKASLQKMKGQRVAVSAKASSVYKILDDLLKKHGMTMADVNIVEMNYPDMAAAFQNGAIQAAITLEPYLTNILRASGAAVVSDLTEVMPAEGASIVPLVYSDEFATKKSETAQAFMTAYMKGVRAYNDAFAKGKDKVKVIDTIARYATIDRSVVENSFTAGLDPNQQVNLKYLGDLQTFFVDQGFIQQPVDLNAIVDLSFATNAVKTLGGEYK